MTKKRVILAIGSVLMTVGLGAGVAAGQADSTPTPFGPGAANMDAMHEQMRDAMPEEMRGQCDAMHAGMQGQMGGAGGGMMGQ